MLGWLAAAGVAVVVGLVAVSALGRGILDAGPPMTTPGEVEAELARPAPPTNGDTSDEPPPNRDRPHVQRTPGGTVVASCDPTTNQAALLSWSPAQGFQADDVDDGPAEEAEISFEAEEVEVDVQVVCRAGEPLVSVDVDEDD